jgi:putative glutamine transport system permease protein
MLESYNLANLHFLWLGLKVTLEVSFFSIVLSFIFGSLLGTIRFLEIPIITPILSIVIDIIRNLPLLLIIFFTYFALPQIIGIRFNAQLAAIFALSVFESAMVSEIVRAGLEAVPKGQMEAGVSTGLSTASTLWLIIIPQAYRMMIPTLVSQFISLVKDTSLAVIISLPDFTHQAAIIYGQSSQAVIPMFIALAVGYFLICYILSLGARFLEKKLAKTA